MRTISTIVDDAEMTPELEETFGNIQEQLGAPFVPNFFKVWAHAPEALNGIFPAMKHILASGKLDRKLKEMIFVAVSSLKDSSYCGAAHKAFCMSMGVSEDQLSGLIQDYTSNNLDPKDKAAIDFAVKLAKDPKVSTENDFKHLSEFGFSTEEVMELMAASAMAVFYDHLADSTGINIDEGFLKKASA